VPDGGIVLLDRHPRRSSRAALAGLALAAVALLLPVRSSIASTASAANTAGTAGTASDLADVKARGKLVMLTFPVQGGFFDVVNVDMMREQGLAFKDLHKPEQFSGIDVDVVNGFAKSLGVELEIEVTSEGFGNLIPALIRREADLVASELTITPARRELVAFSSPYTTNWIAVVAKKGTPIAGPGDLVGKKAAVIRGSSHGEFLKSVAPDVAIEGTGFDLESLETLASGRVDFTLIDSTVPPGQAVDVLHSDLVVAFRLKEINDGIAVRKESDLLAPLDAYLARIKKSGELQKILDRHGFGKTAPKPVRTP
jgi:ABC-type amino acid transport substrate-binding protein